MNTVVYPRISEKTYGLSANKVYVFNIPAKMNKIEVKTFIEKTYDVKVLDVNVTNIKGKLKRTVKRSGKQNLGQRASIRKAYVTVSKDDTIAAFAPVEEGDK